jgi:hypothetical protein
MNGHKQSSVYTKYSASQKVFSRQGHSSTKCSVSIEQSNYSVVLESNSQPL